MADREHYAFSQSGIDESRRLQLLEEHLDPLTIRRLDRAEVARGARCLEIGGGRGSIARWLAERVGADGRVTVTDLRLVADAGTALAEFYRLSMAAIGPAAVAAGVLTGEQATALTELPGRPGFLACGFAHVGVWGRVPQGG